MSPVFSTCIDAYFDPFGLCVWHWELNTSLLFHIIIQKGIGIISTVITSIVTGHLIRDLMEVKVIKKI